MITEETSALRVLLVADPGLPSRRAAAIQETLESLLRETYGRDTELDACTRTIRLTPQRELDLQSVEKLSDDFPDADVFLVLTEVPRHTRSKPLIAEVHPSRGLAVVSCPTLGILTTKKRLIKVLMSSVDKLVPWSPSAKGKKYMLRWGRWSQGDQEDNQTLHSHTLVGGPRLVLGMVMANDPWRTVPKLSGALAAATATAAFGIFYNSIWQISSYLSPLRLFFIAVLAIGVMIAWLLFSHSLLDKPASGDLKTIVLYYNLSTTFTLVMAVTALYLVLVLFIFGGGGIVIDPSFLGKQIEGDVSWANYLDIAWFSAAMGVVAGGIGAGFDSDVDVQKLTHGQRMRQRVYTEKEEEEGTDNLNHPAREAPRSAL